MTRRVEVFTGAYASGKSEISINRALSLSKESKVTLIDLDTVEPAYTLRPLVKEIKELGVEVVTQEDYFGLGETGNVITPKQLNCLSIEGNLVIDVGYGAGGLDILEIIPGIDKEEDLNIYMVINTSKPETFNKEAIIRYVEWSKGTSKKDWKHFKGIISNTHLSHETTKEDVLRGYKKVKEASAELGLPIIAVVIDECLLNEIPTEEIDNTPIWTLNRLMPKALW